MLLARSTGPLITEAPIRAAAARVVASPSDSTVLYRFRALGNGHYPNRLTTGPNGSLYGATEQGGISTCGVVFQLVPPASGKGLWTENVLYRFTCGASGGGPGPVVVDSAGALYGTTGGGGSGGFGLAYKLTPPAPGQTAWTETVLHNFAGSPKDGADPDFGLIHDAAGTLYGVTLRGGNCTVSTSGCGTVFSLTGTGFAP